MSESSSSSSFTETVLDTRLTTPPFSTTGDDGLDAGSGEIDGVGSCDARLRRGSSGSGSLVDGGGGGDFMHD